MSLLQESDIAAEKPLTCPVGGCIEPEKCSVLQKTLRTLKSLPHIKHDVALGMSINGLVIARKLRYPEQVRSACLVLPVV